MNASKNPPRLPSCEACNRTREDVDSLIGIKRGGSTDYLCCDCIDTLKKIADIVRGCEPMLHVESARLDLLPPVDKIKWVA